MQVHDQLMEAVALAAADARHGCDRDPVEQIIGGVRNRCEHCIHAVCEFIVGAPGSEHWRRHHTHVSGNPSHQLAGARKAAQIARARADAAPHTGLIGTVLQIAVLAILFSLDSVVTTVGTVSHLPVMVAQGAAS